jgi:hypothetical protein
MLSYRVDCQQDDGSWAAHEFQSFSDDHAITHALRFRTTNACELYQAERWLATFDRAPELKGLTVTPANDNGRRNGCYEGIPTSGLEVRPKPS